MLLKKGIPFENLLIMKEMNKALPVQRKKVTLSELSKNNKKADDQLQMEAQILMKKFLHEIHVQLGNKKLSRKEFASRLGVGPSYLSQLFYNKKPLTFEILVKCQRIFQIEFDIKIIAEGNTSY